MKHQLKLAMTLFSCLGLGLVVAGCPTNQGTGSSAGGALTGSSTAGKPGSTASGSSGSAVPTYAKASFQLVSVIAENSNQGGAAGASGASAGPSPNDPPPNFTLVFNASNINNTLNDVCQSQPQGGTGSNSGNYDPAKACKCRFVWTLVNQSTSTTVTRMYESAPTQITSFEAKCPGPDVYNNPDEIPDNTQITIQLVPDERTNNSSFTSNGINFIKQPFGSKGDFRDSEGHFFINVFHYSCYDTLSKPLTLAHAFKTFRTNPITNVPIQGFTANEFISGGGGGSVAFSAHSYYYDFYARSSDTDVGGGAGTLVCPEVNVDGRPSHFPFDSTFAISLQKTKDFQIAIEGRTKPGTRGVIGYAARANSDGTCPSFTDSSGRIRRTFRLRVLSTVYPIRYTETGDILDQSQQSNVIFILDRPVEKLGQNPLKPITRLGPKPCPWSYKTTQFGQKCMTDASLAGWNIDGTQIDGQPKCPIFPSPPPTMLKPDGTLVIRPYRPFLPYYIERTDIKACAFVSSKPVDPEIVLSHDDNIFPGGQGPSDFWCAKYYPPAGAVIPSNGTPDPFDKIPGECDLTASAAAIKTNKSYACLKTFDPNNSGSATTPSAGCCQICAGTDCSAQGGGKKAPGRNAVFTPPRDPDSNGTNPHQAANTLPRGVPNETGGQSCFDPFED